jgi:uncharacterized membrane protein
MTAAPLAPTLPPRPGPGLRAAKLLAVGVYLAAVTAGTIRWWSAPEGSAEAALEQVSVLFRFVAIPALLTAAALGLVLFTRAPGAYLRAGWWQTKALLLAVGVPAGHYGVAGCLRSMRTVVTAGAVDATGPSLRLSLALGLLLAGSVTVVALAALRPGWGDR